MIGVAMGAVSSVPMARARDKLRDFALSLPAAYEDHPWGEDVAKVNGKIFVFLGSSTSRRMTVKLDESHAMHLRSKAQSRRVTASASRAG
jgi:predicted DNA-binding protein (MmcQ/YjbR family)